MIHDIQREQLRELELQMQRSANPVKYNHLMCQKIHDRASRITLPRLTRPEMSQLKQHLKEYRRIETDDLQHKFLNLRNCFLIISKFEEHPALLAKIQPILQWLNEYKYIFDLIIESQSQKESPLLDKALIILHLDITEFNILYAHILIETDVSPTDFAPIDTEQSLEATYEETTPPPYEETTPTWDNNDEEQEEEPYTPPQAEAIWDDDYNIPPLDDFPPLNDEENSEEE